MKKLFNLVLIGCCFIFTIAFLGCKEKPQATGDADKTEELGMEYTSAYVCPMHCKGSGSDKPGTCPVCNMDYVVNEDHKGEGHNHDHDHDHDHDHGSHDGHEH